MLTERHLQPRLIDNEFSKNAVLNLLEAADPEMLYFTQEDIGKIRSAGELIDNDLHFGGWTFFPLFSKTFQAALKRAEKILTEEMQKPFNLMQKEIVLADSTYCLDETELRKRWKQYLKDETLFDMAMARKAKASLAEKTFLTEQEPASRKKVLTAKLRGIRRHFDHTAGVEGYIFSLYLNAMANVFDPHTYYFSPTQMENFIAGLSTEGYYFGFGIRETESNEIEIASLLPGGPAWKSGEFNSGDIIEKIRWSEKEWMELNGVTEHDVDAKLAESNQEVMEFVLRKPGGIVKSVRLRKEKLNTEETLVRGFILEGKKKIGYISLPDFYSSWGDDEGARCAGDVAAEILKLRKQNIEGLILDVRYNGGGSLLEAVNMTGIFIDGGPVGIEREKGKEPLTLKDTNRGTVYDGPLVIMVNSLSASASEFLAAALQDYHRAIIVGSNTYGKATAQEMFSLRPGKPDIVSFDGLSNGQWGYLKITTGKTYRINGKSIQKSGVAPDVTLPDLADSYEIREADQRFALSSDSVLKKTYWQPLALLPISHLNEKSHNRMAAHPGFKAVTQYVDYVKSQAIASPVLDWATATAEMAKQDKFSAELKTAIGTPTSSFKVSLHDFGKSRLEVDDYALSVNNAWIKNLSQDISLEEAFNIICDYIDTFNRN